MFRPTDISPPHLRHYRKNRNLLLCFWNLYGFIFMPNEKNHSCNQYTTRSGAVLSRLTALCFSYFCEWQKEIDSGSVIENGVSGEHSTRTKPICMWLIRCKKWLLFKIEYNQRNFQKYFSWSGSTSSQLSGLFEIRQCYVLLHSQWQTPKITRSIQNSAMCIRANKRRWHW